MFFLGANGDLAGTGPERLVEGGLGETALLFW